MKKVPIGVLVACFVTLALNAVAAPPPKVQLTAEKKRVDTVKAKAGGEGSEAKGVEKVSYAITLKDISFGDLPALTVDYLLFVERPKLGEKKTEAPFVERIAGSKTVDALTRQTPQVVTTDEISLKTENLVGNYIYSNGGRVRAEDSVVGVWVRVSQDGQVVGEYAMPSTVIKRGWDKK